MPEQLAVEQDLDDTRLPVVVVQTALVCTVLFAALFSHFEIWFLALMQIPSFAVYLVTLIMLKRSRHFFWRLGIVVFGFCQAGLYAVAAGPDAGFQYILPGLVLYPALMEKNRRLLVLVIGSALCFFWVGAVEVWAHLGHDPILHIPAHYYPYLRTISVFSAIAFGLNGSLIYTLSMRRSEEQALGALNRLHKQEKQRSTELKKNLNDKETLLKEIHHRVKNHLQLTISLLEYQQFNANGNGSVDLDRFKERVRAIARIHDRIHDHNRYTMVDLHDYLANSIRELGGEGGTMPELNLDIDSALLHIQQAVPCGMLLNELLTNSIKHAWPANEQGEIYIKVRQQNSQITSIEYRDNGIGLVDNSENTGTELVRLLARQLDLDITHENDGGLCYTFTANTRALQQNQHAGNVLIAEDEMIIARMLSRSLENAGYAIMSVIGRADQVIPFLEKADHAPGLIIMDIKLGGTLDGIDLALEIRQRWPDISFLFYTGYLRSTVEERLESLSNADLLTKTIDEHRLLETVNNLMSNN